MSAHSFGRILRGASAVLALGASLVSAQTPQGSINVRVTESAGGKPVDQAQVLIVGTTLGGLTNADGRFTFRTVAAGAHTLRVLRVGFAEQKKPVTVVAGQAAQVDFAIDVVAVSLAPVVTTATGEQRRVELGNSVSNIDVSKVTESAPIQNLNDLLNSRAAGVTVTSGTQTGAGARIRIRGQNSLSLSNDPIFIIDGVRMTSAVNTANNSNLFTGGSQPSRVGDLNPEEIENIEIVKGPSAATLYGTDAANGVVLITTKRGRSGIARWNVHAETGMLHDYNNYPTNYTIFGKQPGQTVEAPLNFCNLGRVSTGACTVDSVAHYNLFDDKDVSPLGTGYRYEYGAQLSGGGEVVRYFVSAAREDETGLIELPPFERRRFEASKIPIRDYVDRPNVLGKNSLRTNLNAAVSPKLDLAVSAGFTNLGQRFTQESNATAGLGSQAFGGPGCKVCSPDRVVGGGLGTPLNGYRAWTPGYTFQEKVAQTINRFIGSINANWRPTSWLQNRATVGNDLTGRLDDNLLFNGEGPPLTAIYRDGFAESARADIRSFTVDLGSTASYAARSWLSLKTTGGVQYINYYQQISDALGVQLAPGAQTPQAGATPTARTFTTLSKTLGLFVEEAAAINDRLFVTAAIRTDQNSAFGTNFQRVVYPKGSLSWIVSDEGFFPKLAWLNQLRFRSAYGSSGVQPGSTDALRAFASTIANNRGVDQPAVIINSLGNNDLKPERSSEFEAGFESKFLDSRYSLDLTFYNKKTKDALIDAIVPPSVGSATTVKRNIGAVQNHGLELLVTGQLVDRRAIGIDLSFNASMNRNKLVSLGGTPAQIGTTNRAVEGKPLFGLWARAITGWKDKNGDGILTYNADPSLNEVFVADSFSFRGYAQPPEQATLTTGIDLLNRRFRVQSLFDYRGGNKWYNNTERIRCTSRQNCAGRMNPDASFAEQATVIGTFDHPSKTLDGFFQPGRFVRLRELSVQYTFSPDIAQRLFRSRSVSLIGTGRNLALWTKYRGVDPENDYQITTGADIAGGDFQTLGAPTYFIFRVNLGF